MDVTTTRPDGAQPGKETDMSDSSSEEKRSRPTMGGGGSPVYGLGMIGALVYYWSKADTGGDKARAVCKAVVWPAFVVHGVLTHLDR